jgi:hypothetical protein
VQFLGFAPGAMVAIFAQVLNDQSDILEMAHAGLGMPKPEAF